MNGWETQQLENRDPRYGRSGCTRSGRRTARPPHHRRTSRRATRVILHSGLPAHRQRDTDSPDTRCSSTPTRCQPCLAARRDSRPRGNFLHLEHSSRTIAGKLVRRRCVAPRIDAPVRTSARLLPLRLGRQPPAHPTGVGIGLLPVYASSPAAGQTPPICNQDRLVQFAHACLDAALVLTIGNLGAHDPEAVNRDLVLRLFIVSGQSSSESADPMVNSPGGTHT